MALQAKKISYRVIEVTPGLGQINVFRLSGQKQLPIIVDNGTVIAHSSEIVQYLEKKCPAPKLFPSNPREAAEANLIEQWADTTFAKAARKALLKSAAIDPELREALLPDELPQNIKQLVGKVPCGFINNITNLINLGDEEFLLNSLENITGMLENKEWIVGDSMSIADLAIASQLSLIKFPSSAGYSLADKGCQGLIQTPSLHRLFSWRDNLEEYLLQHSQEPA